MTQCVYDFSIEILNLVTLYHFQTFQESPGNAIQDPGLIQCSGPGALKGKSWDQVNSKQFTCNL